MAVKISGVTVSPQTVTVGQTVTITVTAVDVTWDVIKNEFTDWEAVSNLTNWKSVLNYH